MYLLMKQQTAMGHAKANTRPVGTPDELVDDRTVYALVLFSAPLAHCDATGLNPI